jgi:arabinogalactan endo-1,4-beta-galactosidase
MKMFTGLLFVATLVASSYAVGQEYAIGADISFLRQAEQQGAVFKENGTPTPVLEILKNHGYNWIRLRLFHTPSDLPNDLAYTIAEAQEAKKLEFKLLLDFHYADSWADPGKQPIPKAWKDKSHAELVTAVLEYTRDTTAAFRDAGVLPDMIQIGNEITNGMLWPDGRLPEHWNNFADLVHAGVKGVEAGRGDGPRPKIMIHIERPCDMQATKWFFDKLDSYHVPYDIIGQSYYPWWHGDLKDLRHNLAFMARKYHKDIIVVETAYNWQPGNYLGKPAPFPESPEGQRAFLGKLNRVVRATPDGHGKGVFWWEPAVKGDLAIRGFFDQQGNVLPVVTVFDRFARK